MKNLILYLIALVSVSVVYSQETYWVSTQLSGQLSTYYHKAVGETCLIFADHYGQDVHAFDINQGEWQTLLVPTQLEWTNVEADGNVAMIFNDSIVAAYSAITGSFSAIFYSGGQSSLNMIPYGCIDNFVYFLTDENFYVFDSGDGQWHSFAYTPPGEAPWGGGIDGKGDYIFLSLWVPTNSSLHTLVAYSLHTKSFTEFTDSDVTSFTLLDHGFTFNSTFQADPQFCGGYSAYTGQIITKTHHRPIAEIDPGVWPEVVSPLICELFTTNEQISGNNYMYYMWVYNTVAGEFFEYSFEYIYSGNQYRPLTNDCGGQTASVMILNGNQGDIIECVVYSALTNSFRHFNTPLYHWGSMSFSAGGLFIDGYDANNYFLYDVQTEETYSWPVQWTEGFQPGVKSRCMSNYWSVFAYTEQYEDTTHVISYTRDDASLNTFRIPLRASTSNYRGRDILGLLMTEQGPVVSLWVFSPQYNLWTEKDLASASYFGSEGNYIYINYPDQSQTWFYDAKANQDYLFTPAQQQNYVMARDSVFIMYSGGGEYIGYSQIMQDSSTYNISHYSGQQWKNYIALMIHNDSYDYLLYDGYNNIYAPLTLTGTEGQGKGSWPGGKTALVATDNGYLFAYYPGLINNIDDPRQITSLKEPELRIFPNPAGSVVYINSSLFSQQNVTIEIVDLIGKKKYRKSIPANRKPANEKWFVEINVSNLKSGLYFCRLLTENNKLTKKIIVQ